MSHFGGKIEFDLKEINPAVKLKGIVIVSI